ncbi:MAG: PEGA domain-containing protein [Spirochaetales bacterium]|nr:PEGA domain-containing protein [Spirochaetales bacterium]
MFIQKTSTSLALVLFFLIAFYLPAQDAPRVAVLSFNPVGVSEAEAQILTNLFETAVVNTGAFDVIEQSQAGTILDAQEYSLSGCTDETCAVEIGKLLAAENIILGTVSKLGAKYIVTAKIIDVTSGKNIKADSVEGTAIEDMTSQVNVLAVKLAEAGVSPGVARPGSSLTGAGSLGELFISTVPEGATIFINGKEKGVSPALVSGLQPGKANVEVRQANTYAAEEIDVRPGELVELTLQLEEVSGKIQIVTDATGLDVFLDGVKLGPLGTGLLESVMIGEHLVELKDSDRYWKGSVTVEMGTTGTLEAVVPEIGMLTYDLPEGATAVVVGALKEIKIAGRGEEKLPEDRYNVIVSGRYYETLKTVFSIRQGVTTNFKPELEYADNPETAAYLAGFRIDELEARRRELKREYRSLKGAGGWQNLGWVSGGIAAAGAVATIGSMIWGFIDKAAYDNAIDSFEAIEKRQRVEICNIVLMAGGGTALIFGGITPLLFRLPGKDTPEDEAKRNAVLNELDAVERELEQLQAVRKGVAE